MSATLARVVRSVDSMLASVQMIKQAFAACPQSSYLPEDTSEELEQVADQLRHLAHVCKWRVLDASLDVS